MECYMSYELGLNHVPSRQIFHTWQMEVSLIMASLNYLLRANKEMEISVNAGQCLNQCSRVSREGGLNGSGSSFVCMKYWA